MEFPDERRYSKTHEWHKIEGNQVTIGISKFAVDALTDITYLEITKDQGDVSAGDALGEIESVKVTSDIYAGVTGKVVAINQEVIDNPSIINRDPYGQGWIVRVEIENASQLDSLMTAKEYSQEVTGQT